MRQIKPTTAWWCLEGLLTPREIIGTSADIGYAGIEFAPQEQWDAIVDAGLRVVCVRGHNDITNGLNDPTQHDRIEREILDKLRLAQRYNIPSLVCFSGERKGMNDRAGAEQTIAGLRRVAQAAEEAGVLLALELLNSKVDHPDYQCDHTSWGVDVIQAVDSPAVKLLYDVYHMQIMEGDIIRTIGAQHQHLGHRLRHLVVAAEAAQVEGVLLVAEAVRVVAEAGRQRRGAAGVDQAPAAELARGGEHVARALDVGGVEPARIGQPERVAGGGVDHRVAAGERALDAGGVEQVELAQLDRQAVEALAAAVAADAQRGRRRLTRFRSARTESTCGSSSASGDVRSAR